MNSNIRIYGYLRASTLEQDASRAKDELIKFSESVGLSIATFFTENESGATLCRPELFRLLEIAQAGDVILVEQIDRISRLDDKDWNTLKQLIKSKGLRVVSLDLPTSHQLMKQGDEFTDRMLSAINDMMLDMLAAVARKDYQDRRRRQVEGITKAKESGRYRGRREDLELRDKIASLLSDGKSYSQIMHFLGCARGTVSKVAKKMKEA